MKFLQSWTKKHFKSNFCIRLWSLTTNLCYKCLPYPHYLKPVSGIQIVENGKKWRGEGTRQRKEEGPLYTHPLIICFSQPLIFELSPPSECLEQAALSYYTYLNWTKNQTTMKSLQAWFKSNFTIVNDH